MDIPDCGENNYFKLETNKCTKIPTCEKDDYFNKKK